MNTYQKLISILKTILQDLMQNYFYKSSFEIELIILKGNENFYELLKRNARGDKIKYI
jgi:hypothetical protein